MKTNSTAIPGQRTDATTAFKSNSTTFPSAGRLLAGVLACGLLSLSCTEQKVTPTTSTDDGSSTAQASADQMTGADHSVGEQTDTHAAGQAAGNNSGDTASENGVKSAVDSSGFSGGYETLDTGVDLSQLEPSTGGAEIPAPAFDPIADQNAVPGHLALAEGHAQVNDFGSLQQGDIGKHSFRLISDGEAPLVITRLKPSCGCTVAEVALLGKEGEREIYRTGSAIEPGTEFEVVTELNTTGKSGAVSTSVAIYSNDPRAVFSLNLKADVKPVLLVEPSATLALGELSSVETAKGEVRVSSESLPPYLLTVDDRYLQGQPVEVDLTPIDPDAEGRSKQWNVAIQVGPNFPREGINNFPVVLNTDQEIENPKAPNPDGTPVYHQARVYAQATVLAMVGANPPFVSFGMLRPGEAITNTVRITSMDADFTLPQDPKIRLEGYRGTEFQFADNFDVELLPVEGENALDLDINLKGMPEGFSGSFGGLVVVEVNHPAKKEVQVRFSGVCRAGLTTAPAASHSVPQTPVQTPVQESADQGTKEDQDS